MSSQYFIPLNQEQKSALYKELEVDDERIKQSVDIIKEWLSQEPHLPKGLNDVQFKNLFLNNKCSLEKTKTAIDMYFTLRNVNPDILCDRDPQNDQLQHGLRCMKYLPLPKPTPEGYRVILNTGLSPDPTDFVIEENMKLFSMLMDIRLLEDCTAGDILLLDCKNVQLKHIGQVTPTKVKFFETLATMAFSARLKGIQFFNLPPYMNKLITIISSTLKPKLRERLCVHPNGLPTSSKLIPTDVLPNEFGGTAGKFDDLYDAWKEKVLSYREWFIEQDSLRSDESKRIGGQFNSNEFFGVEGSFRKLNVD